MRWPLVHKSPSLYSELVEFRGIFSHNDDDSVILELLYMKSGQIYGDLTPESQAKAVAFSLHR